MMQIITLGFRVACLTQTSALRRKAQLVGCVFLSVCLLLASMVFLVHGPVHVAPSILSLAMASPIILVGITVLGGWFRALRLPGLK